MFVSPYMFILCTWQGLRNFFSFCRWEAWNLRWRVQQKEDWEIWLDKADWGFAFLESHQLGAPDQPGHPCSVLGVSLFMIHELCGLRLQPLCRRSCIPIINYLLIECTSTYDMYSLHTQEPRINAVVSFDSIYKSNPLSALSTTTFILFTTVTLRPVWSPKNPMSSRARAENSNSITI